MALIADGINRVEGVEKVTGRARYTADFSFPNLAYAALIQSEIPHGELDEENLRECAERARSAPGVLKVITPLNCPKLNSLPRELTWDLPLERRPPLSDLSVQHVGQHIAVIVAETLEQATHSASLFELNYRQAEAFLSVKAALGKPSPPDSPDGQVRHGTYLPDHFVKLEEEKLQDSRGSRPTPAKSLQMSSRYTTARNAHYPIELSSTTAFWEGDVLTVYDATRWIAGERKVLAAYLRMPEEQIRILSPLVGGAFGSKAFLWLHVVLAAVAAREVGRPVKLVLTRKEMFTSTGYRPETQQEVTVLADANGVIQSTEHHTLTETSTIAHFCEPCGLSTRFLYHSPHLAVSHRVARLNIPTPCFMRGPGEAPGLFALEAALDEVAYSAGIDPVELRIRNFAATDQASGKHWSANHLLECYSQGAERFGWSARSFPARSMRRKGIQVGWGMATAAYPGRRMPAGCRVTTRPDGIIEFASATHEVGNGIRTVMTQVACEVTGLLPVHVVFLSGDSQFPAAPYSGASQTTATVGSAVFKAAQEWRRRFTEVVRRLPGSAFRGLEPEQMEIKDGLVRACGTESLSVSDLLTGPHPESFYEALSFLVQSDAGDQEKFAFQSFGAQFCEVEVDEEIGKATVTRWVGVFDCGRVLNPKLARNQIMGGITFGVGMALLEQVPFDDRTGQLIGEYYLPTHADRPHFDISFIDAADYALDPIGARGIGEIGVCGVAGAIANAIFHATGKRLRNLPITLEHLMTPFASAVQEELR